jgi:hypothetical protein
MCLASAGHMQSGAHHGLSWVKYFSRQAKKITMSTDDLEIMHYPAYIIRKRLIENICMQLSER